MKRYVLDANALLGYFGDRPGKVRLAALLKESAHSRQWLFLSVINWGEVVYNIWMKRGESTAKDMRIKISKLPIEIVPVLQEDASLSVADIGARVMTRHGMIGMAEQSFSILGGNACGARRIVKTRFQSGA